MAKRRKPGDPKVAVAYLRVSTDTERQALGVEAQRHAIETWAAREGVRIAATYVETVSGGAPLDKRPVLLEALAAVAAHRAGRLVVHRLDRFSRDPLAAALAEEELRRQGASLACADGVGQGDDPAAELVRAILVAVHRFDKEMIRARIRAALAVKKRRGELTGAAPYGYRRGADGKTLVEDADEQKTIARLREMRASGATVRGVQRAAREAGIVGRARKPFTLSAVHAMLTV